MTFFFSKGLADFLLQGLWRRVSLPLFFKELTKRSHIQNDDVGSQTATYFSKTIPVVDKNDLPSDSSTRQCLLHPKNPTQVSQSLQFSQPDFYYNVRVRPAWFYKSHFPKCPPDHTELPCAPLPTASICLKEHRANQSHVCLFQIQPLLSLEKRRRLRGPVAHCCEQASGDLLWERAGIGPQAPLWLGRVRFALFWTVQFLG